MKISISGSFIIDKALDDDTYHDLCVLVKKPKIYLNSDDPLINSDDIKTYNPGFWCHWLIQRDRKTICWDGETCFFEYVPWIYYIVKRILKPKGYKVSGFAYWKGNSLDNYGEIRIDDNNINVRHLIR